MHNMHWNFAASKKRQLKRGKCDFLTSPISCSWSIMIFICSVLARGLTCVCTRSQNCWWDITGKLVELCLHFCRCSSIDSKKPVCFGNSYNPEREREIITGIKIRIEMCYKIRCNNEIYWEKNIGPHHCHKL